MAKGMRVKLNYEIGRDPDTGVEVTRLTPPEVTCHRNYFYQKCFFNDGSHLLFAGAFDGHWNYYLAGSAERRSRTADRGAQAITPLADFSPRTIAPSYYVKNDRTLLEVSLETRAEREVYRVPDDWVGYGTWVANSDCTSLVGIEIGETRLDTAERLANFPRLLP
ncbi:oligogalacturonide lyase [Enterobacter cloacae]|uniref:Oligogalacturonide lyase n=1 Tax=Enterobacter cloacae TaxID=550 RepID=A0A377LU32_ENTCL|nr:oligogalacturonide lyase [Enterobacter cloacae]